MIVESREKAVSPVVGVILMVAVTVILAALIAQFAFSIVGNTDDPVQAGVLIQEQRAASGDYEVRVTLSSTQINAERVIVRRSSGPSPPALTEVGQVVEFTASEGEVISIVGESSSGDKVVLQQYEVGSD